MAETKNLPLSKGNPGISVALVRKLLHRNARSAVGKIFSKAYPVEVARIISALGGFERQQAFFILQEECEAAHIASVISEMASDDSSALLDKIEPKQIAHLLSELPADDATLLTSRLPEAKAKQVLALMERQSAAEVRELLEHEERTAGRIMTPHFFALEEEVTVSEAIAALQRRSDELEMIFYVYVVDKRNHLIGVVSLRKLLTTPSTTQLRRVMEPEVISARTDDEQEEVARLVAEYNLLALPICDEEDKLVGIVTVDDVLDVVQEEVAEDLLALAGVTAEEQIGTKPSRSLRLRAPWLVVNLITAFIATFVISRFQGTLDSMTFLSPLMSIPMGMGGNAATQTVTVVVRGLAMNQASSLSRATLKEIFVGVGNGLINGIISVVVVAIASKRLMLGVVLGMAMLINLVVAGLAGILIPTGLKRLGIDPAISSTVFVTTCTDVFGAASFLGIATLLAAYLK
ncbi:MAG: magnesium transporter [Acidobacteria bacterium]|nr:magnesium transporter [Acidobacteriota bacterium]